MGLNYDAINMQNDEVKKQFEKISENFFDSYVDRSKYALSQIEIIGMYINDF